MDDVKRTDAFKRTDEFTDTELRLMIQCFRQHDIRALLAEFEAALDDRIKERVKGQLQ